MATSSKEKTSINPTNPVKTGRPSKYDPTFCTQIIELAESDEDLNPEAFAGKLRISKQTLYNWMEAHPEFLDAVNICRSINYYNWYKQKNGDGPKNFGVWQFMGNHFMKPVQVIEQMDPESKAIESRVNTKIEELQELIEERGLLKRSLAI